jgi:hypothetical protein
VKAYRELLGGLVLTGLALGILLFAGCAAAQSGAVHHRRDDPIPFAKIKHHIAPHQLTELILNYHSSVILEGEVELSGKVTIKNVLKSMPDHSQDELAASLVGNIQLLTPVSSESRIPPTAKVYVMFHGRGAEFNEPKFAIIYAEQVGYVGRLGEGEDLAIVHYEKAVLREIKIPVKLTSAP